MLKKSLPYLFSILALCSILFLILYNVKLIPYLTDTFFPYTNRTPPSYGEVGDMYGIINALFSGIAMFLIILTVWLQRKDLKMQSEELKLSREEIAAQNDTLKLQRFENTFFNLLALHHQIVDSIDLEYIDPKDLEAFSYSKGWRPEISNNQAEKKPRVIKFQGRDVFKDFYESLSVEIRQNTNEIESIYMKHYESAQTDFGHYFRNLYRIIKLVDEYDLLNENEFDIVKRYKFKYKYTSIIRAQLSDYELLWLFYNCLSPNGIEKFKPYIERYTILKNLPKDKLASDTHIAEYNKHAFVKIFQDEKNLEIENQILFKKFEAYKKGQKWNSDKIS